MGVVAENGVVRFTKTSGLSFKLGNYVYKKYVDYFCVRDIDCQ